MLSGGCLCGEVRFQAETPIIDAGYCHCRRCQRANASPVVAWATLPVAGFNYTRGQPAIYSSSATHQREFCAHCGTQLAFRRRDGAVSVDFTIASLDEPAAIAPQYHIWRMSKLDWFETADDLPRHRDAGPDKD